MQNNIDDGGFTHQQTSNREDGNRKNNTVEVDTNYYGSNEYGSCSRTNKGENSVGRRRSNTHSMIKMLMC